MANNRFIYPNGDGTASVYRPTDKFLAKLSGTIDEKLIAVYQNSNLIKNKRYR